MLSFVRYTIIALSVVFLLATSVTAAVSPNASPFATIQRNNVDSIKPEPVEAAPQRAPLDPQPQMSGPIFSEAVSPSLSAPVGTLPTAVPPDPDAQAPEMNPRQNPIKKQP